MPQASPPPPGGAPPTAAAAAGPGGPGGPPLDEAPPAEHLSFWQLPFVQNVLPFLTSLTLHLAVITVGILTAKVVTTVIQPQLREQINIAESAIEDENGVPDGLPNPGLGNDPTRPPMQDKYRDVPPDSKGIAEKPGPSLLPSMMGGGSGDTDPGNIYAIGPNSGLSKGKGGGLGTGDGFGPGDGDGSGVLAPFGPPGGGSGIGPRISYIGVKGFAKKVAYVCDASGSMLEMFDALRFEIRKSVDGLRLSQSFNVVFFQDSNFLAADKASLLMATPENKRKNIEFLEKVVPRGQTDPIPALEAVAKMNPEVIFLLTDGDFSGPGNDAVVARCKQLFANGRTKIHTIAFLNKESKDNPQELAFVKALQEIAKNSGGNFRYVSEEDMGK